MKPWAIKPMFDRKLIILTEDVLTRMPSIAALHFPHSYKFCGMSLSAELCTPFDKGFKEMYFTKVRINLHRAVSDEMVLRWCCLFRRGS
jgi:hypothetical protein